MNRILSKFVATALFSAVAITAANAANEAVWSAENTTGTYLKGGELIGVDTNMTLRLNADMNPGTTFDFHVVDGSIANSGSFLLCNGADAVGKYVNLVSSNAAGKATVIGMEFSTDANTSLTKAGELLQLIDSSNGVVCDATLSNNTLTVFPDVGKCPTVFSDNGLNNNGSRTVTEINSGTPVKVLDYEADIMIACDVPICGIATNGTEFTTTTSAQGINKRLATDVSYDGNATSIECFDGKCEKVAGKEPCTTYLYIQNNTDQNITGIDLELAGTIPSGMYAQFVSLDNNSSEQNVTLNGSAIRIDNLYIDGASSAENNATIKITYNPNGTDTISETLITGVVTLDTNKTTNPLKGVKLSPAEGFAKFSTGGTTDFTVTYMNPSFKSFAMISALENATKLSATITDSTGKTAEATFADIEAGKTMFVWADKAGHPSDPLQVAADAAGLNNAWRVVFHVTAAVDVAAYMEANGGQRTLTVLYPEYTNDLTNP